MQERIVGGLVGGLRLVLVVAAVAVAALPIGRGVISGFCPPAAAVGDASGTSPAVSGAVTTLAAPVTRLAEAVATETEEPTDGTPATGSEGEGAPVGPTDGASAPTDTDPTGTATEGDTVDSSPCGEGVERCLPPLVSAVVSFGSGPCGAEALSILRGSMVPAFLLSSALMAGAWLLRPRNGRPVLSRF